MEELSVMVDLAGEISIIFLRAFENNLAAVGKPVLG